MQSNIYVAVSGQLSLLKRLETVAQNIANVGTPGYRTERVSFEEILSRSGDASTSFVSEGQTFISKQSGALEKTGNPLDVAVNGDAWLGLLNTGWGRLHARRSNDHEPDRRTSLCERLSDR